MVTVATIAAAALAEIVRLRANLAEVIVEERGRITRKEPATVRFAFREGLLFTLLSAIAAGDRGIAPRIGFSRTSAPAQLDE